MKKLLLVLAICILPILAYSEFTPVVEETMVSPRSVLGSPNEEAEQNDMILASGTPEAKNPLTPFRPLLTISEALGTAENYAKAERVDLTGQYIHSVQLNYDEGSRRLGHFWRVQWAWSHPRIGGEYGLRIYMDGTVMPEPLGP
jgi:hypothetical protein